ncbi:AraC family transcriptional regulator [Luteolibacter flavescens]|uniref:AraC family transcriptional regulator n=1 Tax=Luteolibacter flavescens TaxID=1859460 RepID=A0ABT3FKW5_9BACT|nr:AraC family transcriptional regulator [Luteolibacter flavescens]MCW1884231.1 AraC family transcriptional regulator [Luteolibacter flavescens]
MSAKQRELDHDIAAARPGRLVELLRGLTQNDGFSTTRLPGVKLMQLSCAMMKGPVSYDPSIVIIAQGRKRGYLGDQVFTYDANHFLVLSVPLPFECETLASPEGPMLGISVGVTPAIIAELMMAMEKPMPIPMGKPEAIRANPLSDPLYDAAVRLVEALYSAEDARILGPQIVREITYRVLAGEEGGPLRALAAPHSHFGQISRALQRIHDDYATPVDMATLASEAGMSVSTFHSHFKAVTSSPPLQYLKTIRLHKARLMMVQGGETAASAARLVGYESASQFSREFKRFFGATPAAETEKLKASLMRLA